MKSETTQDQSFGIEALDDEAFKSTHLPQVPVSIRNTNKDELAAESTTPAVVVETKEETEKEREKEVEIEEEKEVELKEAEKKEDDNEDEDEETSDVSVFFDCRCSFGVDAQVLDDGVVVASEIDENTAVSKTTTPPPTPISLDVSPNVTEDSEIVICDNNNISKSIQNLAHADEQTTENQENQALSAVITSSTALLTGKVIPNRTSDSCTEDKENNIQSSFASILVSHHGI